MNAEWIFWPVLAQLLLTFWVFVLLVRSKARALQQGTVDPQRRALHDDAWPDDVLQVSNNIKNQFQTPVLFYVLCFMLWALNAVGVLVLVLAWAYVATRLLHMHIHTGSNNVPARLRVFKVGVLVLLLMLLLGARAVWLA